jgi:hypothetical protein
MAEKPPSPFARLDTGLLRSTRPQPTPATESAAPEPPPAAQPTDRPSRQVRPRKSTVPRQPARSQAAGESGDDIVQRIRKVVKTQGKEVSFIRLTAQEKGQLADIVYTYKRQGRRTTENEVSRIAVNYLLEDYRVNGSVSMLARVLDALQA